MVPLEDVEDFPQKFRSEPAHCFHIYNRDALACRDGLDCIVLARLRHDLRSSSLRMPRVKDPNGDILPHGGCDGGWMEDLRAKIGKVGCLLETHVWNATRVGTEPGIGGENAVDIGPHLDPGCLQGGTNNGSR